MPTCPKCSHRWTVRRKGQVPKAGMGADPGPARWTGCQGEAHTGDWGDGARGTCARDASIGLHPDGCPCTWCASRRAHGWRLRTLGEVNAAHKDQPARGWECPARYVPQSVWTKPTDWQAFREARQAKMGSGWSPHHTDPKDTWERYYHAQTPAGRAGAPYVAPEGS